MAQSPCTVHAPDRKVPASQSQVVGVGPWMSQAKSHLNPAPHAAEPAAVTSEQSLAQYLPAVAALQVNDSMQREPVGQSASTVHNVRQANRLALY